MTDGEDGRNWTARDDTFVGGLKPDPHAPHPSLPLNNRGRGSRTPVGNQDVLILSTRKEEERGRRKDHKP